MDAQSVLVVTAAIVAGGLFKGATGLGLPLVAIPIMASTVGLPYAISIMIVPILVSNTWQVWEYRRARRDPELAFLPWFLVCAGIGVAIGTFFLKLLPEDVLALVLGCGLLLYFAFRLMRPHFVLTTRHATRLGAPFGLFSGLLHGATGVSGPISIPFIHAMRLDRPAHILAVSSLFLVLATVQLPALFAAGVTRLDWVAHGVPALLPVAASMPVGQWLARRFSARTFDMVILVFLGLMGTKMVLTAIL